MHIVQLRKLCGTEEQRASFQRAVEQRDPNIVSVYELNTAFPANV